MSLFRLSIPILLATATISAGLFAFDYYYLPHANRTQDKLRDIIKASPPRPITARSQVDHGQ